MFTDPNEEEKDPTQLLLEKVAQDIEEVKRYAAGTYSHVDTEINEMRDSLKRIESQLRETDRQVDRMERYERSISDIRAAVQRMERKIK